MAKRAPKSPRLPVSQSPSLSGSPSLPVSQSPRLDVTNAALPASTGVYRSSPRNIPWSTRSLERMMRSRDLVQISRYLQSEEGIPQVRYAIQQLPREAVGKGSGMKSVSTDPDFKRAATALFNQWADSPAVDIRKERTFFELQPQWLSTMWGDGEAFVLPIFEPNGVTWSLRDKSKRCFQLQTVSRDQLTNGTVSNTEAKTARWIDGLKYNGLDQLELIRLNQDDTAFGPSAKFTDIPAINTLGGRNVFHLKDTKRLNQYHGDPAIFASGKDLLSSLDLKSLRTHSATVRAALLGASSTKDGKQLNAMQAVAAAGQTGSPATDSGARWMEIKEGAVFIPLANDESFNFFNSATEAVPFKQILEDMMNPFIFELNYPPEWIFMRGKVGGVEYRGLLQQVSRAHEVARSRLYPLLQWIWEKVISTAMLPGGALAQFAAVADWNAIDFVTDPDPTVDAGRNHQADMDRYGENLLPAEDYVERLSGGDGTATRHQAIDDRIDSVKYAISVATGTPLDQVVLPASIATIIGLGLKTCQAASGLISSLAPDSLAQVLTAMDGNPPPASS